MGGDWYVRHVERVPPDAVDAARTLAAATLYEAYGQRGALDPAIRPMAPGLNVGGPAFTVRCQSGDNLTLHAAVALAEPGDVLVADVGDFTDAGHWGEILTAAAVSRGIAGLVINGGVRDVEALPGWTFSVFARGISMKATTKCIRGLINHPVVCGGVEIHPGDLVVGDADGVVSVSRRDVGEVIMRAREREAREAGMIERLRQGVLTLDLLQLRSLVGNPEQPG